MTLKSLRDKVIKEFLEFTSPVRAGAVTVQVALTGAMLYALATAGSPEAIQALGISLGSEVLTGLLHSHLYDTKDAGKRQEGIEKIAQAWREQAELQGEIRQLLGILSLSQQDLLSAMQAARGLNDDDRTWLREEFAKLKRGWKHQVENEHALRTAYLNRLLETAGRIDLIGIDRKTAEEEDARRAEVQVGAIYVPLHTSELAEDEQRGLGAGSDSRALPEE